MTPLRLQRIGPTMIGGGIIELPAAAHLEVVVGDSRGAFPIEVGGQPRVSWPDVDSVRPLR